MTAPPGLGEQTLEALAAVLVTVADRPGRSHIELRVPDGPVVCICGHPNPALVREHAEALRRFLAAAIRADRAGRRPTNASRG